MASQDTSLGPRTTNDTTIGELRKLHGPHFAPGYGAQDKLGQVLARAGANSLEDYLARHSGAKDKP